ncbi:VWA domain-containing protein [Actinomycetes bacterium KLBMP 9759]
MTFGEPAWLLLIVGVGGLGAAYVWLVGVRRRDTARFTALELLETVLPRGLSWRRHLPTAAILLALVLMTVGLAGPMGETKVPRNKATIMLAIDVSLSMKATDVAPNRLAAAQAAATAFVRELPAGINVGLVTFAGTAAVAVSPTTDREVMRRAIAGMKLAPSTATGEAIFASLQAVETFTGSLAETAQGAPPAHIVLMSDGSQTIPSGPDAENLPRGAYTAAEAARAAGVPVSTIAFGTPYGSVDIDGRSESVAVDERAMSEVARFGGGTPYSAATELELRDIYTTVGDLIGYETQFVDVSKPWFVVGTLLTMAGLGGAVAFGRRIP